MAYSPGAKRIIPSVSSIQGSTCIELALGKLSNSRKLLQRRILPPEIQPEKLQLQPQPAGFSRGRSAGQVVKKNWPFILLGFKGASFGWPLPVLWEQGREAWNTNISLYRGPHRERWNTRASAAWDRQAERVLSNTFEDQYLWSCLQLRTW